MEKFELLTDDTKVGESYPTDFIDLPDEIIEALKDFFEGEYNPDNGHVYKYEKATMAEVKQFLSLSNEENDLEKIRLMLSEDFYVLGYTEGVWHVI